MPRRRRVFPAGMVFHVVNRSAKKARLFNTDSDYAGFEQVLSTALEREKVALFSYCVMPNHWHLLLSPLENRALSRFMHWLTTTHARRWRISRDTNGQGAVYQGRFKAVPVSSDRHFIWVCRYVERNALRASLVERAEEWMWSSVSSDESPRVKLSEWPVARPEGWLSLVNTPQTASELASFRNAVRTSEPYGDSEWKMAAFGRCGPLRPGRPRRVPASQLSSKNDLRPQLAVTD
jgi:putative transposase